MAPALGGRLRVHTQRMYIAGGQQAKYYTYKILHTKYKILHRGMPKQITTRGGAEIVPRGMQYTGACQDTIQGDSRYNVTHTKYYPGGQQVQYYTYKILHRGQKVECYTYSGGNRLHTRNHTRQMTLENATERPLEMSSKNPLEK